METQTLLRLTSHSLSPFPKHTSHIKSPPRTTTKRHYVILASNISATSPKREKDAKKRVVVTGMGLVSVYGNDVDTYYQKLLAGENGIKLIDKFNASKLPTKFGGQISHFMSNGYIDDKNDLRLDDYLRYCIVAGKRALEDAAFGVHELSKVCNSLKNFIYI